MDLASFYRKIIRNMDGERILPNRYDQLQSVNVSELCVPDRVVYNYTTGDYQHLHRNKEKKTKEHRLKEIAERRLQDSLDTKENLKILAEIKLGKRAVPPVRCSLSPPDLDPKICMDIPTEEYKKEAAKIRERIPEKKERCWRISNLEERAIMRRIAQNCVRNRK